MPTPPTAPVSPVHPVDEIPPVRHLTAFGLQHVLAMYAGAVAVPLIVGGAMKLSPADLAYLITADLLVCGIATLIQCVGFWRFGVRLPIMQGCTFAAVSPMVLIGTTGGGLPAIYGSVIVAGLAITLLAPVFGRLLRFFPPLVTGTVILVIGLSLLPVAGNWAAGGVGSADFGEPRNLALAAFVLAVVLGVQRFAPAFLSRIAVLTGIVVGLAVAVPFGFTDFDGVGDADWVGISTPFHFGAPAFEVSAVVSKLGAVVAAVPAPVLGGAGLVMFGTVAASGLRTLAAVEFKDNHNLTVVAVSVAVGMLPVGVPTIYAKFPDWFRTVMNSGISAGCLTAIVLNLLFNHLAGKGGSVDSGSADVTGLAGGGGQDAVE
ncbi:nucleobase:cation symporter-2 family protein [Streptomyces graminilatus]|uniref:nucleobase:cation symporter-2 family protein n=1 Tax=Streptomyces graminilatus TaxID=1464070 RepID=UPI0006E3FA4B|nr:nucleobase:cation symporter-2 family protein [Streptomyces graminilatus]